MKSAKGAAVSGRVSSLKERLASVRHVSSISWRESERRDVTGLVSPSLVSRKPGQCFQPFRQAAPCSSTNCPGSWPHLPPRSPTISRELDRYELPPDSFLLAARRCHEAISIISSRVTRILTLLFAVFFFSSLDDWFGQKLAINLVVCFVGRSFRCFDWVVR